MKEKTIYIIDGNSLLFRAYYATAYAGTENIMRTSTGIPTNAIFAFSNMMSKLLGLVEEGDGIFVGFDADSQTFRKAEFEQYKANRKPCPEELVVQFPASRELLDSLGIHNYELHGIEADDICGTVAKMAKAKGYRVEIYTSDKDYLQLIEDGITVNLIKKGLSDILPMTPEKMKEVFGFEPKQIIDYKGLCGDSSDNLPGIAGIGEKTAVKLITEYGSFEGIIAAAHEGKIKGKMCQNILDGEEMGRACYRLATMLTDVELPFSIDELTYAGYDFMKANAFAKAYELRSFLSRLPAKWKQSASAPIVPEVQRSSTLEGMEITDKVGFALDMDEASYNDATPVGLAISNGKEIRYLDIENLTNNEVLHGILQNRDVKKCVYDSKAIRVVLAKYNATLEGEVFDLLLASYLLDSSLTSNSEQAYALFGGELGGDEANLSLFSNGYPIKTSKMAYYALLLESKAKKMLEEQEALELYNNIELPLAKVLAEMEIEGFPLDQTTLLSVGEEFRRKRDALEEEINVMAGHPLMPTSPKQVAELLYDELHLPQPSKTNRSTSMEVLKYLEPMHPIVGKILEFRKYAKLVSTYIDGFIPHIKKDGKIHTCFNQALTTTGRLSSSNPNLQNISARDEEGKMIRKAFFYPNHEYKILSLDYGQIELRVLAALSKCQSYIDVFSSNRDVHSETARKIFGLKEDQEVPSLLRRRAKAVNFAIIYGVSSFGLANQIDGTPKEAADIISSFNTHYPEIRNYLDHVIAEVEEKGYVKTMFGRRRYLSDIKDSNYVKREAAKRAALNAPVQGSAADLIKVAMLKVDEYLKQNHCKSRMVLQIHDELIFALAPEEADTLAPKLKEIMEHAVDLGVRLTVEGSIGESWYDAKD